jgi:hypothetical protein
LNDSIPKEAATMARALGRPESEVDEALTQQVLAFFEPAEDAPDRLVCPALVRQMEKLMQRREAQAKGGRDGARARREKGFKAVSNLSSMPPTTNAGVETNRAQKNQNQLGKDAEKKHSVKEQGNNNLPDPEFIRQIEAADARDVLLHKRAAL